MLQTNDELPDYAFLSAGYLRNISQKRWSALFPDFRNFMEAYICSADTTHQSPGE